MNKKVFFSLFHVALLCCFTFTTLPALGEPSNLGLLKQELRNYHDNGLYDKELTAVANAATFYLLEQVKKNAALEHPQKLALVLDIDETSLSNYESIIQHDFTSNTKQLTLDIQKANARPIPSVHKLYQKAIQEKVAIFFVTGRHISEKNATIKNLHNAGYRHYSGLYFKPDNYEKSTNIDFKTQARALITKKGYTIIASIGDQYSDLLGGYALKVFKLPNPYYYLP